MTACTHFWQLPIGGSTVVGVCRDCKAERVFNNRHEDQVRFGSGGRPKNQEGTPVRGYEPSVTVKP